MVLNHIFEWAVCAIVPGSFLHFLFHLERKASLKNSHHLLLRGFVGNEEALFPLSSAHTNRRPNPAKIITMHKFAALNSSQWCSILYHGNPHQFAAVSIMPPSNYWLDWVMRKKLVVLFCIFGQSLNCCIVYKFRSNLGHPLFKITLNSENLQRGKLWWVDNFQ